jgi:hypothetical protein
MFDASLRELHAADPEWDWVPLMTVLQNIEYNDDDVALALRDRVRWTVKQT